MSPEPCSIYHERFKNEYDSCSVCCAAGFAYHGYADDAQVCRHFLADQQSIALTALQFQDCIVQILNWMKINRLQLNPIKASKAECLWIRSRSYDHLMFPCLAVGQTVIEPSGTVNNLGIYFDEHLDYQQQLLNLSRGCFF
jgi:hypothetical protein